MAHNHNIKTYSICSSLVIISVCPEQFVETLIMLLAQLACSAKDPRNAFIILKILQGVHLLILAAQLVIQKAVHSSANMYYGLLGSCLAFFWSPSQRFIGKKVLKNLFIFYAEMWLYIP